MRSEPYIVPFTGGSLRLQESLHSESTELYVSPIIFLPDGADGNHQILLKPEDVFPI